MRFPWKRSKEEPEEKDRGKAGPDESSRPQRKTEPQREEIAEDGAVGFEPEVEPEQTSNFEENRNRVTELLLKHGIPTLMRAEHKIEIPQNIKEEIASLLEEDKKAGPFDSEQDENYLVRIGNFNCATGNLYESLKLYDIVLEKNPAKISALNNKGVILDSLERYDDALTWLDKALSRVPENVHVLANKGIVLYKQGKYGEALSSLDAALRIDPRYFSAILFKGHTLYRQGRRRPALDAYEAALKEDPANGEAPYNMACIYSIEGREGEAIASLEKAVRADPTWRDIASQDRDLQKIRNTASFREIVG